MNWDRCVSGAGLARGCGEKGPAVGGQGRRGGQTWVRAGQVGAWGGAWAGQAIA